MRLRDYCYLALCLILLVVALRAPLPEIPAAPAPVKTSWIAKATWWLAVWRLAHGAPVESAPLVQDLPDAVVNAPAIRETGPDGEPLLEHGAGW